MTRRDAAASATFIVRVVEYGEGLPADGIFRHGLDWPSAVPLNPVGSPFLVRSTDGAHQRFTVIAHVPGVLVHSAATHWEMGGPLTEDFVVELQVSA